MPSIQGIDISHYQGTPNFDQLKSQIDFVIIKATEGINYTDPQLTYNQSEARRVGLGLGYYHFAQPNSNTPQKEVAYFLSKVTPDIGEILCLDFEVSYPNPVTWCKLFLDTLSTSLNGYKPLIYLNKSLANGYDWSSVINANYGLWLASYDSNQTSIPTNPWPTLAMKQWTSSGTLNGISGNIDRDTFFGDLSTFKKYGYNNQTSGSESQESNMTDQDLFTKYNVKSLEELDSKINEACGTTWGSETQSGGGYLGAARREVTQLKIDLAAIQQNQSVSISESLSNIAGKDWEINGLQVVAGNTTANYKVKS